MSGNVSVSREIKREFRKKAPWVLGALFGVAGLVVLGAVAVMLAITVLPTGARPPANLTDPRVPSSAHGYATVQVIDCLREGDSCPEFAKSQEYMQKGSDQTGGVTYTVLSDQGVPGQTKTAMFLPTTPAAEYQTFANEVSGAGLVNASTVFETDFTGDTNTMAEFTVPGREGEDGGGTTGRMEFSPLDDVMAVRSITYSQGVK